MGAGSAAKYGSAETGDDEPEAAWSPPGYRQAEPASWGEGTSRPADRPDEDDEQAERPAAGEARWERMVPPYVDDLTRPRRDTEPDASGDLPSGQDLPAGEEAEAVAGQETGSAWSAWSSFRATRAEEEAASGGPSAGDVAEDERDGSGTAEPAELDATPDAALAGVAVGTSGTGETAGSDTEADEPVPGTAGEGHAGDAAETAEPGEAGTARGEGGAIAGAAEAPSSAGEDAAQENGAEQDTAQADDGAVADGTGGTGRAGVASSGGGSDDTDASEDADGGADGGATPMDDEVTIVPGVARYHRRGCILIRFLSDGDLETTTRGEAEATDLVPCKACQPDKPDPSA
jgi:hypothetical protein